jgi:methionine aminopeptidase type I
LSTASPVRTPSPPATWSPSTAEPAAGWSGDAAITFIVGEHPDPHVTSSDQALIATTQAALDAGIAAAQPGARLGDIAHAIGQVARTAGYGLMESHGGHGIGREMHEAPHVPNEGRPGRGLTLPPGLVLALEPMLIAGGTDAYDDDPDGWTLRTADGTRAAHIEHTVAITENGPEVLTQLARTMSIQRRSDEDSIPVTARQIHSTIATGRALPRRGQLPSDRDHR